MLPRGRDDPDDIDDRFDAMPVIPVAGALSSIEFNTRSWAPQFSFSEASVVRVVEAVAVASVAVRGTEEMIVAGSDNEDDAIVVGAEVVVVTVVWESVSGFPAGIVIGFAALLLVFLSTSS